MSSGTSSNKGIVIKHKRRGELHQNIVSALPSMLKLLATELQKRR